MDLIKWKRKANIKSAKTRTAAACGALATIFMKKSVRFLIIGLILLNFLSNSCKKSIFNYRHKYVGEWNFTTIKHYWQGGYVYDTTIYHGDISYGASDKEINIQYTSSSSLTVGVNKDGSLYNSGHINGSLSGNFEDKNTLSLKLESSSAATTTRISINGTR